MATAKTTPEATEAAEAPATVAAVLRRKEFVERVVTRSGLKKKDARTAVDAALAVLREALEAGEELVMTPDFKAKVGRVKELPAGKIVSLKMKLIAPAAGGKKDADAPLAETAE